MIKKILKVFSTTKSTNFFWTDVNKGVKAAEYAVRGIVPMTASAIRSEINSKTKSTSLSISSLSF
jgi:hypothetical protein